jgi:hypothetical protein
MCSPPGHGDFGELSRGPLHAFSSGTAAPLIAMQGTFFQKLILCAIIGACAAGLIEWYKVFVSGADDALNGRQKVKYSVPAKR